MSWQAGIQLVSEGRVIHTEWNAWVAPTAELAGLWAMDAIVRRTAFSGDRIGEGDPWVGARWAPIAREVRT